MLVSIIAVIIGAIVAGIFTYIVSYALEKKKWRASAAILRKNNIYSPVYNELNSRQMALEKPESWFNSYNRFSINEWIKLRDTSDALTVPNALRDRLNSFTELYNRYYESQNILFQQIKETFPESHFEREDYGIANILANKMLIAPNAEDGLIIEYLPNQCNVRPDSLQYWTKDKFNTAKENISNLPAWQPIKLLHAECVNELHTEKIDLQKRIQLIIQRYQRADPRY